MTHIFECDRMVEFFFDFFCALYYKLSQKKDRDSLWGVSIGLRESKTSSQILYFR